MALTNPSFEFPALPGGGYSLGPIPGWDKTGETYSIGNLKAVPPWYLDQKPAGLDGALAGFLYLSLPSQTAGVFQVLPENYIANETYTLTVSFGKRTNGGEIRDGAEFGFFRSDHTPLATMPVNAADLTANEFYDLEMCYIGTGYEGPVCVGITAAGNSGNYLDFDNVRLTKGPVPAPAIQTIRSPGNRQVIQRRADNRADIPVSVDLIQAVAILQARVQVMQGGGNIGTNVNWTTVGKNCAAGQYTGTLRDVAAGGWYRLDVRALNAQGETLGLINRRERVGIGEVFIVAGQSNAANFGDPPQVVTNERVVAMNLASKTWQPGNDPQPDNSGFSGTGGSAWPRFGSAVADTWRVPVGIIGVGFGGARVAQFLPEAGQFYANLRMAVQNFPQGGFRAVLWHQGESDAGDATPLESYSSNLKTIITQTRLDAGWEVPWGVAQASHLNFAAPSASEIINAAQRNVCYTLSGVFRGARTDDFWMQGMLSDGIHFNGPGLVAHGDLWAAAVLDRAAPTVNNGDFEAGPPLDVGAFQPGQIIGFNAVNATATGPSDAYVGVLNPCHLIYESAPVDNFGTGAVPGMSGTKVAILQGGSAGASLLHQFNAPLRGGMRYEVRVALGVRTDGETFGGYAISLLVGGNERARISGDRELLDTLAGGNAEDRFTEVSLTYDSPSTLTRSQPFDLLIQRTLGGPITYLDVDNVRLIATPRVYAAWQQENFGSTLSGLAQPQADPDEDGIRNLFEFAFNLPPLKGDGSGKMMVFRDDRHLFIPRRRVCENLSYVLETSLDLQTWMPVEIATVQQVALGGDFESADYPLPEAGDRKRFYRVRVTLNLPGP